MWITGLSGTAAAAAAVDAGALFLSEMSVSVPVTKVCRIAAALSAATKTESATSPAGSLSTSGCVSLSMLGCSQSRMDKSRIGAQQRLSDVRCK